MMVTPAAQKKRADNLTSSVVKHEFEKRLDNTYWLHLQVMRQLKVDLYKCTKEGHYLSINRQDCFPQKLTDRQADALGKCSQKLAGWTEEHPSKRIRLSSSSSLTAIRRSSSSRLTGEKCPACAISDEKLEIFVVNGKHIYSWETLHKHVVEKARQTSDEVVVCKTREFQPISAYLQSDPLRQPLNKAHDFDLHRTM